jgi:hypothetical protein
VEKIKGAKVVSLFFEENKSEDNEFLEVVKTKGGDLQQIFLLGWQTSTQNLAHSSCLWLLTSTKCFLVQTL